MLLLFLDESGDHNLEIIDPEYPVFVLGGCIVEMDYHEKAMTSRMNLYKREVFGSEDVILHTSEIKRCRGKFACLADNELRQVFYEKTNALMSDLEYMVIACAIKKDDHLRKYGFAAIDPYMLSLKILVERFVYELRDRGETDGHIIAESRDETLDNQLRLAWMDIRTTGTEYVSASDVRKCVKELHVRDKKKNISGLQIADLVVSPIGRRVIGKEPKRDWEIVKSKFRRNKDGVYSGFGLVVHPK